MLGLPVLKGLSLGGVIATLGLTSVLALLFTCIIGVLAKVVQTTFLMGIIASIMGVLPDFGPEMIGQKLQELNCNQMSMNSIQLLSMNNRPAEFLKSSLKNKFPTVMLFDENLENKKSQVFSTDVQGYQLLFVDLNAIKSSTTTIYNQGPILVYSSNPGNLAAGSVTITSDSLISFCQQELPGETLQVSINAPTVVLDIFHEDLSAAEEAELVFPWGKIVNNANVGIYTYAKIIETMKKVISNKDPTLITGMVPHRSNGVAKINSENSVPSTEISNRKVEKNATKFNVQMKRECSWSLDCKIIINQEDLQSAVTSLFDSKGGSLQKVFSKNIFGIGSIDFTLDASNPVVEFVVTEDGVEKLQTTVDLVLATTNHHIQDRLLNDQVIRAVIQSSIKYDNDEWKIYAKDPKVVEIKFSRTNKIVNSLSSTLTSMANGMAGEIMSRVPVYDLNKGGISSGVAGYLLDEDGIKINNSQLEIQMSVF